jgi:hypothetical protein
MQAIIDENGRIEIPVAWRDRLRLIPGAVVDLQPAANGLTVTPATNSADSQGGTAKISREGSLAVLTGDGPVSLDDVNCALEIGRGELLNRLAVEDTETS